MEFSWDEENQTAEGGLRRPGRRTAEARDRAMTGEAFSRKDREATKRATGINKRRGGKSRAMMNSAGKRSRMCRCGACRKSNRHI
jgi:hypothetical protein